VTLKNNIKLNSVFEVALKMIIQHAKLKSNFSLSDDLCNSLKVIKNGGKILFYYVFPFSSERN
jgi:hypothetical protein